MKRLLASSRARARSRPRSPLLAATSRVAVTAGARDFLAGEAKGTAVSADGRLTLAPAARRRGRGPRTPPTPPSSRPRATPAGRVYVATGGGLGRLFVSDAKGVTLALHRARAEPDGRRRRAGRLGRLRVVAEREGLSRRTRRRATRRKAGTRPRRPEGGRDLGARVRTGRNALRGHRQQGPRLPQDARRAPSSSSTRSRTSTSGTLLAAPDGTVYAGHVRPRARRRDRPEGRAHAARLLAAGGHRPRAGRQGRPLRRRVAGRRVGRPGRRRRTRRPQADARRPRPRPAPPRRPRRGASRSPPRRRRAAPALGGVRRRTTPRSSRSRRTASSSRRGRSPTRPSSRCASTPRSGSLLVATGPRGRLYAWKDRAVRLLAQTGEKLVVSAPAAGGRVRGRDERRLRDPAARGAARRRLVRLRREGRRAAVDLRPRPVGGRRARRLLGRRSPSGRATARSPTRRGRPGFPPGAAGDAKLPVARFFQWKADLAPNAKGESPVRRARRDDLRRAERAPRARERRRPRAGRRLRSRRASAGAGVLSVTNPDENGIFAGLDQPRDGAAVRRARAAASGGRASARSRGRASTRTATRCGTRSRRGARAGRGSPSARTSRSRSSRSTRRRSRTGATASASRPPTASRSRRARR